jgi:hypothetical protein
MVLEFNEKEIRILCQSLDSRDKNFDIISDIGV